MRPSRIIAATVLAVALVIGPAVAPAAVVGSASAADVPDFSPSSTRFRAWMINVLGSVLGSAMPSGWRAEQVANQFRYNHSWDDFYRLTGWTANIADGAGEPMPIPKPGDGTYSDFVIQEYEKQFKKGGTGGKPFAPPATKPMVFAKTVGGALAVFTAYEVGNYLGAAGTNLVGGWFGFDAQGTVCGQTTDGTILSGALRYLSGQDCSMWDYAPSYVKNGDAGTTYGPLTYSGYTLAYQGRKTLPPGSAYDMFCFVPSGSSVPVGYTIQSRAQSGSWTSHGRSLGVTGTETQYVCASGLANLNAYRADAPANTQYAATPQLRVISGSGAVVAEATVTQTDPNRRLDCTVTYTDNSTQTAQGPLYKESGSAVEPPLCPGTPSTKTPKSVKVTESQPGSTGTTPKTVSDQPVTPEYQEMWDEYPECRGGACKLDLIRLSPSPAVSCFDLEDGCVDWHTDPNKESVYLCRYGVHDVALSECNVYAGLFQPGRVTVGSPYADPDTGEWSGGINAPSSRNTNMQRVLQDPADLRTCDFEEVGFDPVGWILRGGQCLVEWTAIPRPAVADVAFAGVEDVWTEKPPGAIAQAVSQMNLSASASGCSIMTTYKGTAAPLVDACGGIMAGLAAFSRFATMALFAVLVLGQLRRQIAGMVNYNRGQD